MAENVQEHVTTVRREFVVLSEGRAQLGGQPTVVLPHTEETAHHPADEFKDGQLYVFRGAMDNNCLELESSDVKDGKMIRTWPANGSSAQFWRAYVDSVQSPPQGFRVQTSVSKDDPYALTVQNNYQNHKTVLKAFNGDREQFWHLVKVPGTQNFQLLNASNGKALSNHGSNMNCRTVDADVNDVHQQWVVELH